MVKLDVVRNWNKAVVESQPLVAVFFGGTGAIGHYTLRALATTSAANGGSKGFRAYIVGRNTKAAEDIINECHGIYPQGNFKFVKAEDLSLISEIDRLCTEIFRLEEQEENPRVDYLMMGQGGSIFLPRKDTKEGIDITMALMYYSRMRIITKLLPLLFKSALPARVISVYASGAERKLFSEDLSLRNLKHYSYSQARSHMIYMHTLFMETLAEQNSGKLSLIHIFPGLVLGPGYQNPELPVLFRVLANYIIIPLFGRFITVDTKESGDRMLSLASLHYPPCSISQPKSQGEVALGTNRKPGSGVYSLTWTGEDNLTAKAYEKFDKDEMRKRVWDHTMKAFEAIEAGNIFTG